MASEADSSSLIASTTQESTRTRGPTSAVWIHSRTAIDDKDPTFRYCIPCTKENRVLIFKTKGVPSNLRRHLQAIHSIVIEATVGPVQTKTLGLLRELYT